MSLKHSRPSDCIEEMKEFNDFLMARHKLETTLKDKKISKGEQQLRHLEHKHKSLNKIHNDTLKDYLKITERIAFHGNDNTTQRIEELEKKVAEQKNQKPEKSKRNDDRISLFVNPSDPQTSRHEPIVHVNIDTYGRRKLTNITRDHIFSDFLHMALKLMKISTNDIHKYSIFDLRGRVGRDDDQKMGNALRNVHTFNLIPREMFESNTAYEFHLCGTTSRYNPQDISAQHGYSTGSSRNSRNSRNAT